MLPEHVMMIITTLLGLSANAIVGLLFWRIKRMDQDIEMLKADINGVRINYLNRFQDLKDHNTNLHLQLLEKISILDKGLAMHFASATATENLLRKKRTEDGSN